MEIDHPDKPDDPSDESLDRLLRQSRWPEPEADHIQRLVRHWQTLQRRKQIRRWIGYSLAASIVVASSVGLFIANRHREEVKPIEFADNKSTPTEPLPVAEKPLEPWNASILDARSSRGERAAAAKPARTGRLHRHPRRLKGGPQAHQRAR